MHPLARYKLVAVAGAVATQTRGVTANDSQATGGAAAGKGATPTSQARHPTAAYKREYLLIFYIFHILHFVSRFITF